MGITAGRTEIPKWKIYSFNDNFELLAYNFGFIS